MSRPASILPFVRPLAAMCAAFAMACSASPPPASPAGPAPAAGMEQESAAAPSVAVQDTEEPAITEEPAAQEAQAGSEAQPAQEQGEAPAADRTRGRRTLQPPDGEWLVDDEGRRYFIDKVQKVEGRYTRIEEDVVRVRHLMPIRVEREDDEFFYFRVYAPEDLTAPPAARRGPTEEELAELDASFAVAELPSADRLQAEPFGHGLPDTGQWRNGFDVADVDGDGHLDIVHGPARKGAATPHVFLGDGAGNWRRWEEASFPPLRYDYGDAAAADFDGDGRQDVALAMHLTGIVVLTQEEDGSFHRWSDLPLRGEQDGEDVFTSRTLATADWTGDGRPDLLALAEGPVRSQFLNRENPPLENVDPSGAVALVNSGEGWDLHYSSGPDEGFGQEIAVADFDGDGRTDFATATSLLGFDRILKIGQEDGSWKAVPVEELRHRALLWSVTTDDFNGDGQPDLALSYFSSRWGQVYEGIDILYNRLAAGEGWRRQPLVVNRVETLLDGSYPRYMALGSGDLDGDGRSDLVALAEDGDIAVFLGREGGGFTAESSPELAAAQTSREGCTGYHVRLVDLDGDGRDEIIAGFAGEPGSEQFSLARTEGRCVSNGSLNAWKLAPAP